MTTKLVFKINAQSKGAQKAYRRFIEQYGLDEGRRIFLARADERGIGSTLRQKVNSVYRKGSHLT